MKSRTSKQVRTGRAEHPWRTGPGDRDRLTEIESTDDQPPVSERAAGIYVPRLLLENFREGIARTYIYELVDMSRDPDREKGFAGFGLLRSNSSPSRPTRRYAA